MTLSGCISRNSLRAVQKQIGVSPIAAFSYSKPALSLENEQAVKAITRKRYKELPVAKKLPDGSNASALDEWLGGLERPRINLDGPVPEESSAQLPPYCSLPCKLHRKSDFYIAMLLIERESSQVKSKHAKKNRPKLVEGDQG